MIEGAPTPTMRGPIFIHRVNILDSTGHTELRWDPEKPEELEKARETVQALKEGGFAFFLADGRPADEVAAGQGFLLVRRLSAEEVQASIQAMPVQEPVSAQKANAEAEKLDEKTRRAFGRRPKITTSPASEPAPAAEVVAVRQQRGG